MSTHGVQWCWYLLYVVTAGTCSRLVKPHVRCNVVAKLGVRLDRRCRHDHEVAAAAQDQAFTSVWSGKDRDSTSVYAHFDACTSPGAQPPRQRRSNRRRPPLSPALATAPRAKSASSSRSTGAISSSMRTRKNALSPSRGFKLSASGSAAAAALGLGPGLGYHGRAYRYPSSASVSVFTSGRLELELVPFAVTRQCMFRTSRGAQKLTALWYVQVRLYACAVHS